MRGRQAPRITHFCPQCGQFCPSFKGVANKNFLKKGCSSIGKSPKFQEKTQAFLTPGKEVFAIVRGKVKFALWLTPEVKEMIEEHYLKDNCDSRSEFIEKAVVFYCGFLNAVQAENYLPKLLRSTLLDGLEKFGDRICRLLFKVAVEENITHHILSADTDLDEQTYDRLRRLCVEQVSRTDGKFSFKDALMFQKSG